MSEPTRRTRPLLVEGFVIIASILLAFGIDAWWDEWDQRNEIDRTLEGVAADFQTNVVAIDQIIAMHQTRLGSVARFNRMSVDEIRSLPADSLSDWWLTLVNPMSFEATTGALDALIASGRLELIDDPGLRADISEFRNELADSEEERRWMQDRSQEIWTRSTVYGGPWRLSIDLGVGDLNPLITHDNLVALSRDEEFMGTTRLQVEFAQAYSLELTYVREAALRVLESLEAR